MFVPSTEGAPVAQPIDRTEVKQQRRNADRYADRADAKVFELVRVGVECGQVTVDCIELALTPAQAPSLAWAAGIQRMQLLPPP